MAAARGFQSALRVKPILSLDKTEARRRVFHLYKAWYRQIPYMVLEHDVPITVEAGRKKLREIFEKNRHVNDIRAIDMLVIKGQMELVEVVNHWKQACHIMTWFQETVPDKPEDFLSKFFSGKQ